MSQSKVFRRLCLLVLSLILYTVIGGVVFFYVENCTAASNESERLALQAEENLTGFCQALLSSKAEGSSHNDSFQSQTDKNYIVSNCILLVKNFSVNSTLSGRRARNCSFNIRNFMPWATFATRVVFTVGPDGYSPTTSLGHVILIFYGVFGIPFGVLMLYYAARFITGSLFHIIMYLEFRVLDRNYMHYPELKVTLLSFLALLSWILGISAMTASAEFSNIPYFDAVTHWFLLCTTLGTRRDTENIESSNDWGWKDIISNISMSIGLSLAASFALSVIVFIFNWKAHSKQSMSSDSSIGNDQVEANPVCFAESEY